MQRPAAAAALALLLLALATPAAEGLRRCSPRMAASRPAWSRPLRGLLGARPRSMAAAAAQYAHDEVTYRVRKGEVQTIPQAERYSSKDWVHNLRTLPTSRLLKRIGPIIMANTCWALFVFAVHSVFQFSAPGTRAHGLIGGALGLLLVFRTNTAYNRFWEGRKIWEQILNKSRDLTRMSCIYSDAIGARRVQRLINLVCVFPLVLQEHLQGFRSPHTLQPYLSSAELRQLERVLNRPLLIANKMAKEVRNIPDQKGTFSSRERLSMLNMVNAFSQSIGACERIVQTPVPLQYSRHTSRFLSIWCLTLPLAMVGELGIHVVPFMGIVTWGLYGILEIGLLIEEPFQRTLKLEVFANTIHRDVTDMLHVSDITEEPLEVDTETLQYSPPFHQLVKERTAQESLEHYAGIFQHDPLARSQSVRLAAALRHSVAQSRVPDHDRDD